MKREPWEGGGTGNPRRRYRLTKERKVIPVPGSGNASDMAWAKWMHRLQESGGHSVACTQVGDTEVSTVFVGIDFSFGRGRPLVFETMAFGPRGEALSAFDRYSTWVEAELGHARIVAELQ